MDHEAIAAQLRARADELTREMERLTAPPDETASIGFGKRVGEGTIEAVERLSTTATAMSYNATLRDIARALEKLQDGSYGTCDGCGAPIPEERLEARPTTSVCVTCSAAS